MGKYLDNITILVFSLLVFTTCKTQQTIAIDDQVEYDLKVKNKAFAIDELGFLYLVTDRNELVRYDDNLAQEFAYSNERLGSITSVDVNNPFKLLCFYENYQTIIVLDNLLGEVSRYPLFDLGYNNIEAIGISNDNNVWLYDPIDYKLKKIDNAGSLLVESITMYNEGLEYIKPDFLKERENKVFLYDSNYGFFVFDNLGQFIESIPIKDLESFQILNENKIIYLKDDQLQSYDLVYKSTDVINPLSEYTKSDIDQLLIFQNQIYLRNQNGVLWKTL